LYLLATGQQRAAGSATDRQTDCALLAVCTQASSTRRDMTLEGKASPYSIAERRVPELIPVLGSQPAGDMSHKVTRRYRLPLLSAGPAVTLATLKRAATSFAA